MKRKVKSYIILLLFLLVITFSGCSSTNEIVAQHINEEIIVSGDLQHYIDLGYEARSSQCEEKHIEVSGIISDKYTSTIYYIGSKKADGLRIECWFDAPPEGIEEGDSIVADGVCVYSFSDELVLYGCQISEHIKAGSEESTESTINNEVEEVTTETVVEDKQEELVTNTEENKEVETEASEESSILQQEKDNASDVQSAFDFSAIPAYSGNAYVSVNNNIPFFNEVDMVTTSYESYSNLDSKGRCGVCIASVGIDIMPTEDRGDIGNVKPSGWNQVKYPGIVDGNYLYNRCHLIGYQLTGENANVNNLITGTRYLNINGMLPFENMVADYVKESGNHVIYRVTPIFENENLLASGVLLEAKSVEDNGEDILFCVYCYNVQPGVSINYADGSSSLDGTITVPATTTEVTPEPEPEPEPTPKPASEPNDASTMVWLSATGKKYHSVNDCGNMNPSKATQVTESEAISRGKGKCSKCW